MIRPSPEIEALVRRLFAARASGDEGTVVNLFSESHHFLALGSDQGEWWFGAEARDVVTETWASRPEESDTVSRIEAFENGSMGWAAVEGRRSRPRLRPYGYHMTVGLQLEGGAWKVVYAHFSVLASDEVMNRVELSPGLSYLLDSLEDSGEAAGDGLRQTGTVVFTDIVDSTALSSSLGDRSWTQLINDHMRTLAGIVEESGGRVVKTLGDGAMFLFPSGAAALEAATRIQRELSARSQHDIRVRVGIHSGDLVVGDDDLLGLTVNKAARVASAAVADQILVSATTAGLVNHNEYAFGNPISAELKGLDGAHLLFPLDWS